MSSIPIIVYQVEPLLKKLFWGIWENIGDIGGWDIEDIFWDLGSFTVSRAMRFTQTTRGLRGMESLALVQCRTSTVLPNKHLMETILQAASFRKGFQSGCFR